MNLQVIMHRAQLKRVDQAGRRVSFGNSRRSSQCSSLHPRIEVRWGLMIEELCATQSSESQSYMLSGISPTHLII